MKNVAFYTSEQFLNRPDIASSRIRAKWLLNYWPEASLYQYGRKYAVIVFQKTYLVDYVKLYDGIKILDICDPDWVTERAPIQEMAQSCHAITVSTPALQRQISQFVSIPVVCIPDRLDLTQYTQKKKHFGQAKEAVWFGYSHNAHVLKDVAHHLLRHDIGLSIISDKLVTIDCVDGDLKQRWTQWDLATFNHEAIKSDFALLPLSNRPNDRYKSNNRTLTAWALGLPVVTTNDDLKRFLDPLARQKEADARWVEVQRDFDVRQSVTAMQDLIDGLATQKTKAA